MFVFLAIVAYIRRFPPMQTSFGPASLFTLCIVLGAFWYCEVGPGYKPPAETIAREARERAEVERLRSARLAGVDLAADATIVNRLGWVAQANKFQLQWRPARFLPSRSGDRTSAQVDLSGLNGLTPLAVRLAWPLFDAPDQPADTCCPGSMAQTGRSACVPGNCPLYTLTSGLPANPFFATVGSDGKCSCPPPQVCSQ